eukprot:TRINITY_DN4534_c0_g5_i1.p1 TRINITY_DN4534_c0_g5~~TRINITY_DN4534_c0_g5_i1.p1  ORF type:complete len:546 (-),score=98.47 TRINITY_DN4534_c0_g5_i1:75-1712(-)
MHRSGTCPEQVLRLENLMKLILKLQSQILLTSSQVALKESVENEDSKVRETEVNLQDFCVDEAEDTKKGEEAMKITRERKKWVTLEKDPLAPVSNKKAAPENIIKLLDNNTNNNLEDSKDVKDASKEIPVVKVEVLNDNIQVIPPSEINLQPVEGEFNSNDMDRDDLESESGGSTFSRADNHERPPNDIPIECFAKTDLTTTLEQNISVDTTDIKVIKKLGSVGQVYLGRLVQTNTLVALKQFLVNSNAKDAQITVESLANEVELIKQLDHPNVIKYLGFHRPTFNDTDNLRYNIVMEYMEKGSLFDILKYQSKGLTKTLIQSVLRQVLTGLEYLHARGILHRNLKPSNVLVDRKVSTFKITDFELATQIDYETPYIKRECAGTPWYMAPEIILGEPYSYTADIWSLGCLALELFTGKKPFDDCDGMKAMNKMVSCQSPLKMASVEVRNALQYRENAAFLDFLNACWKRDPALRPPAASLLKHPFLRKLATGRRDVSKDGGRTQNRPMTGISQTASSSRFKATKNESRALSSKKQSIKTPRQVHK